MILKFKKGKDKSSTFVCLRDDGTTTYSEIWSEGIIPHDMIHFVIESQLGIKNAFLGVVNSGSDITQFSDKNFIHTLPQEAIYTEELVGIFQSWSAGAITELSDIENYLNDVSQNYGREVLDKQKIQYIKNKIVELYSRWIDLKPGESMELEFYF